jgi:hypothetical protein
LYRVGRPAPVFLPQHLPPDASTPRPPGTPKQTIASEAAAPPNYSREFTYPAPLHGPLPLGPLRASLDDAMLTYPAGVFWSRFGDFGFVGEKMLSAIFEAAPSRPGRSGSPTLHRVPSGRHRGPTTTTAAVGTAARALNSTLESAYPVPPRTAATAKASLEAARPCRADLPCTTPAPPTQAPSPVLTAGSTTVVDFIETPPQDRLAASVVGNRGEDTAYPQRIVATRPLYRLQDRFAQLSRLQRI